MSSMADITSTSFKSGPGFGASTGKFRKKKSQNAFQVIKVVSVDIYKEDFVFITKKNQT